MTQMAFSAMLTNIDLDDYQSVMSKYLKLKQLPDVDTIYYQYVLCTI